MLGRVPIYSSTAWHQADGAGEALGRRLKRSFNRFFQDFCVIIGPNELTKILATKAF